MKIKKRVKKCSPMDKFIKFEIGKPVYTLTTAVSMYITQSIPNNYGDEFKGYAVHNLGIAVTSNSIAKQLQNIMVL